MTVNEPIYLLVLGKFRSSFLLVMFKESSSNPIFVGNI